MNRIIFISGPCGGGKTTLAGAMAKHEANRSGKPVYVIHGDDFHRGFVERDDKGPFFADGQPSEKMKWLNILRFNWDCILAAADRALQMGVDVVIDYIIEDEMPRVLALAKARQAKLYYIVLTAAAEEIEKRIRARGDADMIGRALFLKRKLDAMPENRGHLCDSTGKTPEDLIREMDLEQYLFRASWFDHTKAAWIRKEQDRMKRVIWIVLDSVGAGYLPDAAAFGDEGANTLGHIAERMELKIPHMLSMGLGALPGLHLPETEGNGAYGRAMERSAGKDTTTGHWEMAGVTVKQPFPLYPDGFPKEVMDAFEAAIGTKTLGNKPASGTAILDELGEEHMRTGYPIVYTSGDSVFQIACHEDVYPVEKLYEMCETARAQLQGKHGVGRVIARPFIGTGKGAFQRTGRRRDFSLKPIAPTILDVLKEAGYETLGVGKIEDIFAHRGLTGSNHAAGNPACIDAAIEYMRRDFDGLLFVNLVDFDSVYGHRRDVEGYGRALEYFDERLPEIQKLMGEEDLLIITADHGCDPAYTGTDHTREYVPLLLWKKGMRGQHPIGTRDTFADTAATVAEYFGLEERFGAVSYLKEIEAGCENEMRRIQRAADAVEAALGRVDTAIVLGSGLGDLGNELANAKELSYAEIPGFPKATVAGHAGKLILGELAGRRVLLMSGRFHSYEGHPMADVVLPVRVMKRLGVKNLILTNAAGGVNTGFAAGCLMLLTDFINLTGKNPLTGPNLDAFGPRFPDMTDAYDPSLRSAALNSAKALGIDLKQGVYCWMNGPTYETPAEVRMARILGADAVGMSTVPETIAARHCGMRALGLSCITNMAAGVLDQPINHREVMEMGRRVRSDFIALLTEVIKTL